MTGLILETSADRAFLALSEKGVVSELIELPSGQGLSSQLHPSLSALLKGRSLSYIVTGTGPGSYAGTRTALTVARTLAFALKLPLIGFCSPLFFFPNRPGRSGYLVDAKMGQVALLKATIRENSYELDPILLLSKEEAPNHLLDLDFLITTPSPHPELIATAAHTQFLQGHFPSLEAAYFR